MQTIQEKAQYVLGFFEQKTRDDSSRFWCLKEGRPDNIQDLMHDCHAEMMPDDFKYEMIHDSLEALREEDESHRYELLDNSVPVYNNELLKWLSSNLIRAEYCDEAFKEFGFSDTFALISSGYLMELREVAGILESGLENLEIEEENNE